MVYGQRDLSFRDRDHPAAIRVVTALNTNPPDNVTMTASNVSNDLEAHGFIQGQGYGAELERRQRLLIGGHQDFRAPTKFLREDAARGVFDQAGLQRERLSTARAQAVASPSVRAADVHQARLRFLQPQSPAYVARLRRIREQHGSLDDSILLADRFNFEGAAEASEYLDELRALSDAFAQWFTVVLGTRPARVLAEEQALLNELTTFLDAAVHRVTN